MKKYIVVTPFFPEPNNFRGPFVYDQVNAIKKARDYEVIVFKPTGLRDKRISYEYEGVRVYLFPTFQSPSYFFNGIFNDINSKKFLSIVESAGISIKDIIAVHCHTSTFGAYGLALKRKNPSIKVLLQHHDKDPFTILNGKLANWRPNAVYRAKKNIEIFNRVDVHVAISNACKENLLSFPKASNEERYVPYVSKMSLFDGLEGIKPQKVSILYNGVDIRKFYKRESVGNHPFTIGCIGNFIPLKGQKDLIMAIDLWSKRTRVNNYKLIFIGSGPELPNCQQLVTSMGMEKNVEFKSEVSHDRLVDDYNSFDLFILPSYFDGFGCVCLESAACGVPYMISRNQGACEYFVEDEIHLWSFNAGDQVQISRNIEYFYDSRPTQHLKYSIDINELVSQFLLENGL